jgi:biotin carboxyl carrier protein
MEKKENLSSLNINSTFYLTRLSSKFLGRKPFRKHDLGLITSFIPGTVIDILVSEGRQVKKGDELLILDAMKMQNRLRSSIDGMVKQIHVRKGVKVQKGTLLIEISHTDQSEPE